MLSAIVLATPFTAILKIVCDEVDAPKPFRCLTGKIEKPKRGKLFF